MTGILGGAFDPPHVGHVALAEAGERGLRLEEVVVVVVADPGHKEVHAPAEARLELARLAFPRRDVVLDHHARTVDLLRELRQYPLQNENGERPARDYAGVIVPFELRTPAGILAFFGTTTVFGTPIDITLSELAVEAFFPADEATAAVLRNR